MALQPTRPAGSSQRLTFVGNLVAGETIATYPKTNGTYSSDAVTVSGVAMRAVRLGLFDASDLSTQLPSHVFDDTLPVGSAPHDPVLAGVTAVGFNATDQIISARTWCKNARVTVRPLTAAAQTAIGIVAPATSWLLDSANSGLGLSTGLPVALVLMDLGATPAASIAVVVEIEIIAPAVR